MESAVELKVPNKVDYESGASWGQIKQEIKMIKNLKDKAQHAWLMHREYIIGAVIGFIVGAIIL